jgi:AcrR family transcriptional regulator
MHVSRPSRSNGNAAAGIGPHRPRSKPPAIRREELLDAAERLFLAHGIATTSVDQIVAAADVAKGTFYLYFASKERLLDALQERYVRSFCRTLAAAMERRKPDDWLGRLLAWVEAAVAAYLDQRALHDVVFHKAPVSDRHTDSPAIDQLTDLLSGGVRAGVWAIDEPRLTAVMLFHAMHGAVDEAIAAQRMNRRKLNAALKSFFRRAVGRGVPA